MACISLIQEKFQIWHSVRHIVAILNFLESNYYCSTVKLAFLNFLKVTYCHRFWLLSLSPWPARVWQGGYVLFSLFLINFSQTLTILSIIIHFQVLNQQWRECTCVVDSATHDPSLAGQVIGVLKTWEVRIWLENTLTVATYHDLTLECVGKVLFLVWVLTRGHLH